MKTKNCTGCLACYNICPTDSITQITNSEGFIYPQKNLTSCVNCGLCEKTCPIITPHSINKTLTPTAFAGINKNEKIRTESSSGGIFTAIAEKIINNGGFVFGAKFDSDFSVIHTYTDNIAGLSDFRGSKYVQSKIGNSFRECKKLLDSGRQVLFSGTPCQIGGLKNYLQTDYQNLITVDLICHGAPSPLLWQKYIHSQSANREISRINFRDKSCGWKNFSVALYFSNNQVEKKVFHNHEYMKLFLKNVCLRSSCYNCDFKGINRISDITLADFWGIQHEFPELDDNKGTSFVIAQTHKGKEIICSLDNCIMEEIPLEKGAKYNPPLVKSVDCPISRTSFFTDMITESLTIKQLAAKYAATPFLLRLKKIIKRYSAKLLKIVRRKK